MILMVNDTKTVLFFSSLVSGASLIFCSQAVLRSSFVLFKKVSGLLQATFLIIIFSHTLSQTILSITYFHSERPVLLKSTLKELAMENVLDLNILMRASLLRHFIPIPRFIQKPGDWFYMKHNTRLKWVNSLE